jgi:hypothetical protein
MSAKFGRPPFTSEALNMAELQAEHDEIFEEIEIVEEHIHGKEHWFGISADQSGDNWGGDTLFPFACTSGNADYLEGGKAKVLGEDDTPIGIGSTLFDLHRLLVTAVSEDTVYKIRIIWGTGTMVQAISNGEFTVVAVKFDALNPQQSAGIPFNIIMPRLVAGTKVWAEIKNITNLATLSFYIGLHEYLE